MRYPRVNICIAFVLASSFSLLAQSDRMDAGSKDNRQSQGDFAQPLLIATLGDPLPTGNANHESELPDAPSTAKPDGSAAEPAASQVAKKESAHGAPPAAMGGPLWVDGNVADRNYLLLTGAMFGATVANTELTLRCLNHHPSCNDVPSSFRSRLDLYAVGIPANLGIDYLTYHLKRKHYHLWFVPAAAVTGANLFLAVRAYRWTQDPSLPIAAAHRSIR